MTTKVVKSKVMLRGLTLKSAIKIAFITALGSGILSLLITLPLLRFLPQAEFSAANKTLLGTISMTLLWAVLSSFFTAPFLGFAVWLSLRVKGSFSPLEIEVFEDENAVTFQKPNKALEPTTTSVTSPAAQEPRQP